MKKLLTVLLLNSLFLFTAFADELHERMVNAAYFGETAELSKILSENSININYQDRDGRTAIWYASYWEHIDTMKVILAQEGIDVNLPDFYGIYIYDWIIYEGKWEAVDLLREAGAIEH